MNAPLEPVTLTRLLRQIADVPEADDVSISDIAMHSGQVTDGSLFVAVAGRTHDARRYIKDAESRGARAVCFDSSDGVAVQSTVPAIAVPELSRHVGEIASRFFGCPSEQMSLIGVTGTNGKSTCAWLVASALGLLGRRCGFIGTLGVGVPPQLDVATLTTPDAVAVQRTLRALLDDGAVAVAMEISSHALDQHRADGAQVGVAVFTNLSRDHLDYHGDMQSYADAKARLFDFPGIHSAVVNCEDELGRRLLSSMPASIKSYSYGVNGGDISAADVRVDQRGLRVTVKTDAGEIDIQTQLFGRINVANVLAVFAVLQALDVESDQIASVLGQLAPAPGRMERIGAGGNGPTVVVDYSHTPDSLEKALQSLREHTDGELWCVFGCGGDRDVGKRPMMGAVAYRLADRVIVTDDNPRSESAANIAADIVAGMKSTPLIIHDRAQAISHAIENAQASDVVLVAGKGHESTQQINDDFFPMSDRQMVSDMLGVAQ